MTAVGSPGRRHIGSHEPDPCGTLSEAHASVTMRE